MILSHADKIKRILNKSIEKLTQTPDAYVKRPGRDFTRKRKLSLTNMAKLLISMKGNSLNKEIFEYTKERGTSLTASALKLEWPHKAKLQFCQFVVR